MGSELFFLGWEALFGVGKHPWVGGEIIMGWGCIVLELGCVIRGWGVILFGGGVILG